MSKKPLRTETETSPSKGALTDYDFGYDQGRMSTDIEASFRRDASFLGMGVWLDNVIAKLKKLVRSRSATISDWVAATSELLQELSDDARKETDSAKRGIVREVERTIKDIIEPYMKQTDEALRKRLDDAWEYPRSALSWHQGMVAGVTLKAHADKQTDPLSEGWIRCIAERVGSLPSEVPTPPGAATSEELIKAALDRLSGLYAGEDTVEKECLALQRVSQRRIADPILKLINEFKQEISHLAASDAVKAGYLRNVVSDLEKLVEPDIASAIKSDGGITNGTEPNSSAHTANAPKPPRRRRDDMSPVIDSARGKAQDRDDGAEVWTILVETASTLKPPVPLIAFKDGEIEHGDRANPSYLSKDAFGSRFRRLLRREALRE